MTACFADTAYFIALLSPADVAHTEARARATIADRKLVTTSAVLSELGNHFAKPPNRAVFTNLVDSRRDSTCCFP